MSLENLISNYGYAAIVIGTFLEGETILILGGFAAHRGYLELPWVMVSAFAGTLFGDQFYFYLGRNRGKRILEKRPQWQPKFDRALILLDKYQILLVLGFRFLYGLRTITPFFLGASRFSPVRFLLLNLIGALIWALVIGVLGYLFGQALELAIGNVKKFELWVFLGISLAGFGVWIIHFLLRKKRVN